MPTLPPAISLQNGTDVFRQTSLCIKQYDEVRQFKSRKDLVKASKFRGTIFAHCLPVHIVTNLTCGLRARGFVLCLYLHLSFAFLDPPAPPRTAYAM
jgi:hypothetical protein